MGRRLCHSLNRADVRTYTREYTAYATYNGRTPEAQYEHDHAEGMSGFIIWVNSMVVMFKRDHPEAFVGNSIHDHDLKQAYFEVKP
ncbi:MAG: hypothetical protein IPI29_08445 [Ignavibacteria bacterium]|nr:hypothetical protein [Ignavibacteria bacterium]